MNCASCSDLLPSGTESRMKLEPIPPVDMYCRSKHEAMGIERHEIEIVRCDNCDLIQVVKSPPPSIFYESSIYESSSSPDMKNNFLQLINSCNNCFTAGSNNSKVLDIGCNDGLLLSLIHDEFPCLKLYGVDPSPVSKITCPSFIHLENAYFPSESIKNQGPYDVIISTNALAHIPSIGKTANHVFDILTDDGYFIIEVSDFSAMARLGAWDYIYHEHLYYYTSESLRYLLNSVGLQICEIQSIPTKGGSLRVVARKTRTDTLANKERQKLSYSKSGLENLTHLQKNTKNGKQK